MQQVNTYFQIIKRCKQQNNSAQRLLYNRYAPVMQGLCFRYISDPKIVKELLQKGFIKVFSKIKSYTGGCTFECWMKPFFINCIIEHLMMHKQIQKHMDLPADFLSNENDKNLPIPAELSESELLLVLDKLPVTHRIAFNLFCIEHYSHEEIASMLDVDMAASQKYLCQAMEIMQNELYKISSLKLITRHFASSTVTRLYE